MQYIFIVLPITSFVLILLIIRSVTKVNCWNIYPTQETSFLSTLLVESIPVDWIDQPVFILKLSCHTMRTKSIRCVFEYCQTQQFTQTLSCYIFIGSPMSQQLTSFYRLSLTTCHLDNWKILCEFLLVCVLGWGESLLNNVIQKPCPAEANACGA